MSILVIHDWLIRPLQTHPSVASESLQCLVGGGLDAGSTDYGNDLKQGKKKM